MGVSPAVMIGAGGRAPGGNVLAAWAESLSSRARKRGRGCVRFAFYGRVSTEDWQDPGRMAGAGWQGQGGATWAAVGRRCAAAGWGRG